MPAFPVLPALLLLTLACLAALLLALWPVFTAQGREADAKPAPNRPVWTFVLRAVKASFDGRGDARPVPPRTRPGGRGAPHARRRRLPRARSG
jgi:hypothetical protein